MPESSTKLTTTNACQPIPISRWPTARILRGWSSWIKTTFCSWLTQSWAEELTTAQPRVRLESHSWSWVALRAKERMYNSLEGLVGTVNPARGSCGTSSMRPCAQTLKLCYLTNLSIEKQLKALLSEKTNNSKVKWSCLLAQNND